MKDRKNILLHMRGLEPDARTWSATRTLKASLSAVESLLGRAESPRLRIGVWDLGAYVGKLPALLASMNEVQDRYRFFAVQATVPVGMIRTREGV
ncbi:MAG TPA: hypothetical protein VFG76_05915, partial [Candidatus Polarisedimenticolia bacterium]|nr:hypothetical protein [Candidatus Polarisedimenticolia bacterium]